MCADMQVYYNNVLSLPLIGVLMWWYGELVSLRKEEALHNPMFLVAACASALVTSLSLCREPCQIIICILECKHWHLVSADISSCALSGSLGNLKTPHCL